MAQDDKQPEPSKPVPWPQARDSTQVVYESKREGFVQGWEEALRDRIRDDVRDKPDLSPEEREARNAGIAESHQQRLAEALQRFDREHEERMQRMEQRHNVRDRNEDR